ncbi:helix-turn-helix domain-containing protein [Arenicellales bacterium nBUS_48]
MKPETLSRIFRRLSEAGILEIDGNSITVIDMGQLLDLSGVYAID